MHNNRQKSPHPRPPIFKPSPTTTKPIFPPQRKSYHNKPVITMTMASLYHGYDPEDIVTIDCKGMKAVVRKEQGKGNHPLRKWGRNRKSQYINSHVYVCPGKDCLQSVLCQYENVPEKAYIFAAKQYQNAQDIKSFRTSHTDLTKPSALSNTASQKDLHSVLNIKKPFPFKKLQENKGSSQLQIPLKQNEQYGGGLKKYSSHKTIPSGSASNKRQFNQDDMFTVEEIKQSMQSGMESGRGKQNSNRKGNENVVFDTLGPLSFAQQKQQQTKPPTYFHHQDQLFTLAIESKHSPPPSVQPLPTPSQSTTQLTQGLITHPVKISLHPEQNQSFKIAGDAQIQKICQEQIPHKQDKNNPYLQQLSSIVSNHNQTQLKYRQQQNQQQIDSIKKDIENITQCIKPFQRQRPTPLLSIPSNVQRIELKNLAHQRQQLLDTMNDRIEITQKNDKKGFEQNQYMVKYNVRFLDKKSNRTEVVRLSPLKFRKKEEVVHHLLRKKIIDKEVESIDIP